MKSLIGGFIGLVLSIHVGAEPLLEGRVRLSSGQPAVGVQVRLFDLTDLRRSVGTTTDAAGYFALPLQTRSRGTALPTDFALGQNYPNPFNPSTIIPYQLPIAGHVRLDVFNVLGQRLATLVDAERSAGAHTAKWDATGEVGRAVGAGVYIYRLSSGGMTESRRMVLVDGQAGIPAVGATTQGPVRTVEGAAEADGSVYGLTVSGEGLVAYVDPAFRVGIDEADIVIEEHGGSPRMKLTTDRILGDVNNDGQVDVSDVLYVALYSRNPSVILPNNGDISLGDVNGDGMVDVADALLLIQYITDPSDPALPPGIGQAASVTSVNLDIALSHIYWTDSSRGTIYRANLDGSNVETLVTGAYAPVSLALDVDGGHIYWIDWEPSTIHRANLDGSNVETLPIEVDTPSSHQPLDLALDVDGGHIYWTASSTIHRANLDGSNAETLISWVDAPDGLALDVARGQMYWMEWDTSGRSWEGTIRRANLDGSNIEILPIDVDTPLDLALDVARGQMYWTGSGIHRANLDGSNIETLDTEMTTPLSATSGDLVLDVDGSQMYWTDLALGTLHRANLNGSNIETLDTGVGHPYRLALDMAGGHIYWTGSGIHRVNLDGSNIETLISGVGHPYRLALDVAGGHIYWLDWGIHRANLDGTNIKTLIEPSFPHGIALGP